MKQVTQRLRDGEISVIDVPPPALMDGGVLVDVRVSLLSSGTERSKVLTGSQSLLGKARSRPDQVRQVVDKAQRDGVRETLNAVRSRLDQPSSLGYSAAGVVLAVGERVSDLLPGDRVACAGAEYAVHADVDQVPSNLCVRLPDEVDFASGAFATVGSIALQGVRQADVRIGERVAVLGLGLVGQIAARILRAAGCRVIGSDLSAREVDRAVELGAADVGYTRDQLNERDLPSEARDCDAVLITAATRSSDPVELAAALCRDRGRVVVLGDVGMDIPRAAYYEKELELRLSRSYGPGRYDREYEERGLDYPVGYVRWTERRNMEAFLELVATRRVDVAQLVTDRLPIDRAPEAYELLVSKDASPLAILLEYEPAERTSPRPVRGHSPRRAGTHATGVIGAGSFAQGVLIPALAAAGFELTAVGSARGRSAYAAQARFGFERSDDPEAIIGAPDVELVTLVTRHSTHAQLAARALESGKAVFVEKPPCLTVAELHHLESALGEHPGPLAVGFNRRHAPLARKLREHIAGRGPVELLYRVNAGRLPEGHWLNDLDDGGGRLLGEGCHFVDFACWLIGALPRQVSCAMVPDRGEALASAQSFTVTLTFDGGSVGTVAYTARGATGLPKEYVEAHSGGRSAVLHDFRSLDLYDGRRRKPSRTAGRGQDKGHRRQFVRLRELLESGEADGDPHPLRTMATTLAALRSAELGRAVSIDALERPPADVI